MTNQPFLKHRWIALAATVILPLAAVACSAESEDRAETVSGVTVADESSTTVTTAAPSGSESDGDDVPAPTPGPQDTNGGEDAVLASATGQNPATAGNETLVPMRIDITRAQRLPGEVVEVGFTLTNTGDEEPYEPWRTLSGSGGPEGYHLGGAALLDLPNDKRYLPLFDSGGACLCTEGLANLSIEPGGSASMTVQFPAPPEDVATVEFTLPGFDPVIGLELS